MKKLAALLTVAALQGCATQQQFVWDKQGAGGQEFYQDQGQCRAQAFGIGGVTLVQAVLVFESCMQGKGWYKRPV